MVQSLIKTGSAFPNSMYCSVQNITSPRMVLCISAQAQVPTLRARGGGGGWAGAGHEGEAIAKLRYPAAVFGPRVEKWHFKNESRVKLGDVPPCNKALWMK